MNKLFRCWQKRLAEVVVLSAEINRHWHHQARKWLISNLMENELHDCPRMRKWDSTYCIDGGIDTQDLSSYTQTAPIFSILQIIMTVMHGIFIDGHIEQPEYSNQTAPTQLEMNLIYDGGEMKRNWFSKAFFSRSCLPVLSLSVSSIQDAAMVGQNPLR